MLGIVTLATAAKAFWHPDRDGDYGEVMDGLTKGGIGTGLFLATSALVPGPVWVGIISGLCVGAVVHRATSNVSVADVTGFINRSVKEIGIGEKSTDTTV